MTLDGLSCGFYLMEVQKMIYKYLTIMAISFAIIVFMAPYNVFAQNKSAKTMPSHIFVDMGACPFECCTYRQWTADDTIKLFDRPNGKKIITYLYKGEIVEGITGEIISTPVPTKADRDIIGTTIKSGDIFYVIHYDEEGYYKVWFHGKLLQVHQSVVTIPSVEAKWWVKIKNSKGKVGWSLSNGNFLHQDACE